MSPSVTDSVEDLRNQGLFNGNPSVLLILLPAAGRQYHRNRRSRESADAAIAGFDSRSAIDISTSPWTARTTIRASLHDVERTLCISIALVILVVFLFLRNGRATLIPSVAVPVSLIGTFGVMYLLGYSLDNLR